MLKTLTKILLKGRPPTNPQSKTILSYWEAGFSIVFNLIISLVKFYISIITGSIALKADAVHTLSDTLTSMVVFVGAKLASIPPDKEHPHGHGRIEWLSSLAIAILLIFTGINLMLASYKRISAPSIQEVPGLYFILLLLFFSLLKEFMFRVSYYWGKFAEINSLIGDAYHHRADALASTIVVVGFIIQKFNFKFIDGLLGIVISLFILKVGLQIIIESSSLLVGKEGKAEDLRLIKDLSMKIKGVEEVHKVEIHDYGNFKEISLHILLDENMSLKDAHLTSQYIEDVIKNDFYPCHITIHTEPFDLENSLMGS